MTTSVFRIKERNEGIRRESPGFLCRPHIEMLIPMRYPHPDGLTLPPPTLSYFTTLPTHTHPTLELSPPRRNDYSSTSKDVSSLGF